VKRKEILVKLSAFALLALLAGMVHPILLARVGAAANEATEKFIKAEAISDAHVISTYPDVNYGLEKTLQLRNNTPSGEDAIVFLKFDLYGLYGPTPLKPGDEILWAAVSVWGEVIMGGTPGLPATACYCNDSVWTEQGITWNNAPWAALSEQLKYPSEELVGYGYNHGHELNLTGYAFVVTTAVQQAHESAQELTLAIRANGEGARFFWARQEDSPWGSEFKPVLEIQFIPKGGGGGTTAIDTSSEFSSGTLEGESSWFWYTWINVSSVQLIYIAAVCPFYSMYFPSFQLTAQHFYAEDGTELFIGHMLLLYEVYDDKNRNGVLDADFSTGDYETLYYLDLNMSEAFIPQPVQKTVVNGTSHYTWSLRYEQVWGFLKFPEGPKLGIGDTAGLIQLQYLETSYDYCLRGNASYLKTSLAVGPMNVTESYLGNITFTNLGLTALYSTIVLASSNLTRVLVGLDEYDSHLPSPTTAMSNATIAGPETGYYSLLFEENYTLATDPPQTYPAPAAACPSTSLDPTIHEVQYREPFNAFRSFLTGFLPTISNLSMPVDYDFRNSDLLYRVNYPHWDGCGLVHDPLYVAYLGNAPISRPNLPGTPFWLTLALAVGIFGVLVLSLSVVELRRLRRAKRMLSPLR